MGAALWTIPTLTHCYLLEHLLCLHHLHRSHQQYPGLHVVDPDGATKFACDTPGIGKHRGNLYPGHERRQHVRCSQHCSSASLPGASATYAHMVACMPRMYMCMVRATSGACNMHRLCVWCHMTQESMCSSLTLPPTWVACWAHTAMCLPHCHVSPAPQLHFLVGSHCSYISQSLCPP